MNDPEPAPRLFIPKRVAHERTQAQGQARTMTREEMRAMAVAGAVMYQRHRSWPWIVEAAARANHNWTVAWRWADSAACCLATVAR